MTDSPKASIIIRTYNEAAYIERLMYGISQQEFRDFEIVLVDSGSTDQTVSIAKSFGARIVNIPKSEFSFGRSLNRGCETARGELIVIASGHVYPLSRTWLGNILQPFENAKVAVSYGKQRGDHRTKFSEHMLFRQWFPDRQEGVQSTYFCNNANCAVRRSDWANFPYDEQLTGLEDLKYAKHFYERGREIHYRPNATIAHVHEETWMMVRNRYMREAMAMKQIDTTMTFSLSKFAILMLRHVVGDTWHAIRLGVLLREFSNIISFRFNQLWGTFLGYSRTKGMTDDMRRRFYYPGRSQTSPGDESNEDMLIDYTAVKFTAAERLT